MKEEQLQGKIAVMLNSEFMNTKEMKFVNKEIDKFIKKFNDEFGYNDGEPLDEFGIKFIVDLMKYKWKLTNAVVDG